MIGGKSRARWLTEGEGFEPSGRLATASDFRDRAEPAAVPHHNWSLHPGGIQGGMNLSRWVSVYVEGEPVQLESPEPLPPEAWPE